MNKLKRIINILLGVILCFFFIVSVANDFQIAVDPIKTTVHNGAILLTHVFACLGKHLVNSLHEIACHLFSFFGQEKATLVATHGLSLYGKIPIPFQKNQQNGINWPYPPHKAPQAW